MTLIGGMVLAFPIAVKIIPALPVGGLCLLLIVAALFHHSINNLTIRAVGALAGVTIGLILYFLVIPSLAIGPTANTKDLHTWVATLQNDDGHSDEDFSVHAKRNQSLANAFYRFGNWVAYKAGGPDDRAVDTEDGDPTPHTPLMPMDNPWATASLHLTQLGLLALLFAAGYQAARQNNAWGMAAFFALSCLLIAAISPVFRGHYYVFWLPAAWIVPLYNYEQGRPRLALSLAITACLCTMLHYVLLQAAGRMGELGLGTTVWFVVAAISLLQATPASVSSVPVQTNERLRHAA
jgi:hypothetical protein